MTTGACKHCGSVLASDGLCARCEFALALESPLSGTVTASDGQDSVRRFGEYELIEEVGHGGMGVVYQARHVKLNRIVALKMLLLGPFSSWQSIQRFQREAQAAAALKHPNIVSLYEIGELDGQHYFTMEYVDGQNLAALLREGPLPGRQAAGYCQAIAEAISAAHAAGIVHRDLKPSNILIDPFDQPRITDFGLAKWFAEPAAGSEEPSHSGNGRLKGAHERRNNDQPKAGVWPDITITGQMLGSPNYLAPEIAAGRLNQAGPRSDLYSIGAILYECLAGRPPVMAATLQETLFLIRDAEPVPLRPLNPSVPRDLETICLKCLQKEPCRRYPSAQELASDLERFLKGEPITARPVSSVAKVGRWCLRRPALASLTAALALALIVGMTGVLREWRRAEAGELHARQRQYASDMNLVQEAWEEGNVRRAQGLLRSYLPAAGALDLRGFEWRYLSRLCQDEGLYSVTNLDQGIGAFALAPGGQFFAVAVGPGIKLFDSQCKEQLGEISDPRYDEYPRQLAFPTRNTNVLVTLGDKGTLRIWNLSGHLGTNFIKDLSQWAFAVSPDGARLAIARSDTLSLWSVEPKKQLWSNTLSLPPRTATFSPDGAYLISGGGGGNGNPRVWDVASGRELPPFPELHKGWIEQITFSPDGKTLATCADDDKLILWDFDPAGSRPKSERLRHAGNGMAFSPNGLLLASIGYDLIVRVREVDSQREVILRSLNGAERLAFTPDSQRIVAGNWDALRVWNARRSPNPNLLQQHRAWVHQVALSPDGSRLASIDAEDYALVWDVLSRRCIARLDGGGSVGGGAAFSPDGRILVTSSYSGKTMLWDAATLELRTVLTNACGCSSLSFSPDGKILALATGYVLGQPKSPTLYFWDVAAGKKIDRLAEAAQDATAVQFSHDGQKLSVGYFDGSVRIWSWTTGRKLAEWHDFDGQTVVAFSPDDTLLAVGFIGVEHVVLYRMGRPRAIRTLDGHTGGVRSLAFAPDGRTLACGGNDGMVRLWSTSSYQPVLVLKQHTGGVNGICFSQKGDLMASCDAEGDVRLWPAAAQ